MKIGQLKRFTPGDYSEAPEWAQRFFQQLNNVLEDHTNALARGLTFGDNIRSEPLEIDIQNNVTTSIKLTTLKRNPVHGLLTAWNYFEYPQFAWQISPDKPLTVEVRVAWENPPDKEVRCTFIFFGGNPDERNID